MLLKIWTWFQMGKNDDVSDELREEYDDDNESDDEEGDESPTSTV